MTSQLRQRDFLGAGDPGFLDDLYRRFIDDPHAVPRDVAKEFAALLEEFARAGTDKATFWRTHGHRFALLRSFAGPPEPPPAGQDHPLAAAYSGSIGWEFMHVEDAQRRTWIALQAESLRGGPSGAEQAFILDLLTRAEKFERGLQLRFPGEKRFGLEGAEGYLVLCETIVRTSASLGVGNVVIGGMHRGRLNILAHLMMKPVREIIAELTGQTLQAFDGLPFAADVPYHNGYSTDRLIDGRRVHLSILPHPSHLSIVAPVALGKTRGLQDRLAKEADAVLPLVMHTDAAFAGQGVISEMLQLSALPPFTVGGAIHLVLNNNIGFTTDPDEGRSTHYCTDIAKAYGIPVIHVNGDDPDAVFRAANVAAEYRARFRSDIVVDFQTYRRRGHNELDEPRFTQPLLYAAVDQRASVATLYAEHVAKDGRVEGLSDRSGDYAEHIAEEAKAAAAGVSNTVTAFADHWSGFHRGSEKELTSFTPTGVSLAALREAGRSLTTLPDGFAIDPKVVRFLEDRRQSIEQGRGITWATAEALAFATLADEGFSVRLGGQDTVRGAFAHRHFVVHDQNNGRRHPVLPPSQDGRGEVGVFNTPLAEYSVVAFEYGYSLASPNTLVCWEAQFGDFLNIAQAVMDQFIACGEERWLRSSGLVLLLPHGLDGGGPDHSTARPERLLNACANGNMEVINASTPAQYFHLLRRQMLRRFRKPLALLAPKMLLRSRSCVSTLEELGPGTGFRSVLAENVTGARRVILCSGKIYFELWEERGRRELQNEIALVRVEQLYPLAGDDVRAAIAPHPGAELLWCEEEPANMGAFLVLRSALESAVGRQIRHVGRPAAGSPAVGDHARHEQERHRLLAEALTL
ncbi:MAG: 2-oxoglutarate dehydrogenase E1 component [Bauldia sp.]